MKKVWMLIMVIAAVGLCSAYRLIPSSGSVLSFRGAPATKEQLGEMLFFEPMLSADRSLSCASCHIPAFAFADTVAFSKGVGGRPGKRNAPSCANLSDRPYLFYDGRAASLEDQVHFPVEDSNEMSLPFATAVSRLNASSSYVKYFRKIFGKEPTAENLAAAIAAFERTLETSKTPFDRYMNDDEKAISAAAIRGREVFMGPKAKCFECHFSPDFTGDEFRNIGLYDGRTLKDEGRYTISHNKEDLGKFRVPGLRNVGATAPYMHNGMFRTLKEVIEYYDDPYKVVPQPVNMDTLLAKPLGLTATEKEDLEQFLLTLTDDRFAKHK
jgi:cytochrome c peroxidase